MTTQQLSKELEDLQLHCEEHDVEYDTDQECPVCERISDREYRLMMEEQEAWYASGTGVIGATIW